MATSLTVVPQRISVIVLSSILVVGIAGAVELVPFWPQFHGPNRDNISTEEGLLKQWPENGPDLVWTAQGLGHGFSTVSIAGGMIYTAGNIGGDTVITALDLDGKMVWQATNGKAWTRDHPGTRGTPTIDGDHVYHESPLGEVICLDAKTGKTIWQVNIIEQFQATNIKWALSESLLIDGDHVICCPGGPETSMVALNKRTGAVVWKAPSTGEPAGYASPILVEQQGLRIIVTMTSRAVIGVNADTGKLLWHVEHESYMGQNVMVPLVHDGYIFITTLQGGSVKWQIRVVDGGASLKEVWRSGELENQHGGAVLVNGNLYGTSSSKNRNQWVCLDWETGKVKHVEGGVGKGSPTVADGMLYTLGERGTMGLVQPTAKGHEMVSSFRIPEGGKGNSWAHPVVCAGRLYIRHGEFLYAYDVGE